MNCSRAESKIKQTRITHLDNGSVTKKMDLVVREVPLTIVLNGKEVATLLCSPEKLDFLAAGHLLSEGFINRDTKLERVEINEKGWIVRVKAEGGVILSGRNTQPFSGTVDKPVFSSLKIGYNKIVEIMKEFQSQCVTFQETGGVHACALCNEYGIHCYAEDIGRHNALDKIIGECFWRGLLMEQSMVLTTGRVSSEIVVKLIKVRIPVIVSRSAPTNRAIDLAQAAGMTLVGFARDTKMNIYCGEARIDYE